MTVRPFLSLLHSIQVREPRVRDEALAREGYLVVRLSGFDVLREPELVYQGIEERVRERMRELGVD